MLNGLNTKIDVKLWPVEVTRGWLLHSEYSTEGLVLKPREIFVGQEQLPVSDQEPDTVTRDVGHFNARKA
jgi:hypothetical protein